MQQLHHTHRMSSDNLYRAHMQGRYSFVGARPALEVLAKQHEVTVIDHMAGTRTVTQEADPLSVPQRLGASWKPVRFCENSHGFRI